jgi:hypothetical protein
MNGAAHRGGRLWAITSYFNPARYRRRFVNYRTFRAGLGLPLATIELSFDGIFQLQASDADVLVQIRGRDVMWQKERLLNHLLPLLPDACREVVALDCDLVFPRSDWVAQVAAALGGAALVQPFRRVWHLPADAGPGNAETHGSIAAQALASAIAAGRSAHEVLDQVMERDHGAPTPGFAWAAARDLLERHGFYDACIIGGGDTALASAAFGAWEHAMRLHCMNPRQRERYFAWAETFHREVRGSVTCLDSELFHLWHGTMADRRPRQRHQGLGAFAFDPEQDLALAVSGCWQWASDKPELHAYVRDYFFNRKEDGQDG